jgi:hypothetical protein
MDTHRETRRREIQLGSKKLGSQAAKRKPAMTFDGLAPANSIDVHSILVEEIKKQTDDDSTTRSATTTNTGAATQQEGTVTTARPASKYGAEDYSFYLDSFASDGGVVTPGTIAWNLSALNGGQDVQNCIQVTLGSFYFPKAYIPPGVVEEHYYKRIFVEMVDAPSGRQGYQAQNAIKFHFEFEIDNISGQAVRLVPVRAKFNFQRAVTSFTRFGVRFWRPSFNPAEGFSAISVMQDRVQVELLLSGGAGTNPARFRIVGLESTSLIGPVGTLDTPVAVGFTGFTSGNPTFDNVLNTSNNSGYLVTAIITDKIFEVQGLDSTGVSVAAAGTLIILKNRIMFSARFTCLTNNFTNSIMVTQD